MAGLGVKKDGLSHEMGMHTEGLLGRTQQRFFDVKETGGVADGVMLVNDAGILDRHVPAPKFDEAGAEFLVCLK